MKRFLAPVLAFVCSLLLCGTALAVDAAPPAIPTEGDVWDGTTEAPTTIVQKDGVSYYEITKCSQLAYLATVDEDSDWLKYSYLLANDLILNNVTLTWDKDGNLLTNTEDLREWTPIPTFSGTLEGNGYAVSGLYISGTTDAGLFETLRGSVRNLYVINCHVEGISAVGGVAAGTSNNTYLLSECSVAGVVKNVGKDTGEHAAFSGSGGLVGYALSGGKVLNCSNYAIVYGVRQVGGIVGYTNCGRVSNCANYGAIYGKSDIGGIVGMGAASGSFNFAFVCGENCVGGIVGSACYNNNNIENCFNAGNVHGINEVGGIVGNTMDYSKNVRYCYSIGTVTGTTNVGSVIGESGSIWGKGSAKDCFYLADETITGFGNGADVENSVTATTATELKQQNTFSNWNFNTIWAIDPEINGGYPYLQWQSLDTIPVTGVSLNKTMLALGVGDAQYLTAAVSPVTAETTLSWKSSDTEVATVTKRGKVTALAPGSATVSVTTKDGGFSASCTVTVTARAQDEYRLGTIQLESMSGETLTAIPKGSFWVSVLLTHLQESGNAVVMLATYDAAGQYLNALCARAEDLPKNSTVRLSLLVDNGGGEVAQMKAFVVPSLSEPMPIGAAAAR